MKYSLSIVLKISENFGDNEGTRAQTPEEAESRRAEAAPGSVYPGHLHVWHGQPYWVRKMSFEGWGPSTPVPFVIEPQMAIP